MKEKLYTIPVNDAFSQDCECPICVMRKTLEDNAIEYTMGPSYMEDDVRMETDRLGFCRIHMMALSKQKNKLGLALILKTHMDRTIKEIKELSKKPVKTGGLFKKVSENPVADYIDQLNHSCFICERINNTFNRYITTILHLWKHDPAFKETVKKGKGFCTEHFGVLLKEGQKSLNSTEYEEFISIIGKLYLEHMQRVTDDVDWFTDKFDYRYADAPWKNSKDAIPRAIIKTNGIIEDEEKK